MFLHIQIRLNHYFSKSINSNPLDFTTGASINFKAHRKWKIKILLYIIKKKWWDWSNANFTAMKLSKIPHRILQNPEVYSSLWTFSFRSCVFAMLLSLLSPHLWHKCLRTLFVPCAHCLQTTYHGPGEGSFSSNLTALSAEL